MCRCLDNDGLGRSATCRLYTVVQGEVGRLQLSPFASDLEAGIRHMTEMLKWHSLCILLSGRFSWFRSSSVFHQTSMCSVLPGRDARALCHVGQARVCARVELAAPSPLVCTLAEAVPQGRGLPGPRASPTENVAGPHAHCAASGRLHLGQLILWV